jgi:hypothetical protein
MGQFVRGPGYVSAAISHKLRDQIELEADKQNSTISTIVRQILEKHFQTDNK